MSHHIRTLLVGAGPMAISYAHVLRDLQIPFHVSGRGPESAARFAEQTSVTPKTGGLDAYLKSHPEPETAIVATGVENLFSSTRDLLQAGVRRVLVEKPGSLTLSELHELIQLADYRQAEVLVAYNRRYYASVARAREIIEEDGGLRAVYFEFTEWSHVVGPLSKAPGVKGHWFLANSTHVVDLFLALAGRPREWEAFRAGGSSWHPSATRFVGAGVTERDILFSYVADWEAPGRWGLELLTSKTRIFLRPMEEIAVQKLGSVAISPVELDDQTDKTYKPGLLRQVKAFLEGDDTLACTLQDQEANFIAYNRMAGYAGAEFD